MRIRNDLPGDFVYRASRGEPRAGIDVLRGRASKPGSSSGQTSLYLRHQPRRRPSRAGRISASRWWPSTPYSFAQVGDVVAVRLDSLGFLDVVLSERLAGRGRC